VEGAGSTLIIL